MAINWEEKILSLKPVSRAIEASKTIVFPGFEGLNLYEIISFLIKGFQESSVTTRAYAMAFKFLLAVFPAIIFLFTLIAYIPVENLHQDILSYFKGIMPKDAYSVTVTTIEDLLKNKNGSLLSFGFLITIYLSSNGIYAMMEAFNECYHIRESRSVIQQRFISLMLVFVLTLMLVIASVLIVFGEIIINALVQYHILEDSFTLMILTVAKWLVVLLMFYFGISLIYFLGPDKKAKFRMFSAGSTFTTLITIATSLGFAYYVNNFGTYNKIYGSIGTLMVVMLWIYFNSLVMILGFELNATIFNIKSHRE